MLVAETMAGGTRPLTARCSPAGTRPPAVECTIRGARTDGSLLRVTLRPMATPTEAWPDLFAAAEAWVDSLRAPSARD